MLAFSFVCELEACLWWPGEMPIPPVDNLYLLRDEPEAPPLLSYGWACPATLLMKVFCLGEIV